MLKRLILIVVLAFAPAQVLADAAAVRERIIAELRDDGYLEIRINRTLLGRMRFVAKSRDTQREIVVNPNTGVILRDYIRFLNTSGDGGSSRPSSQLPRGGSNDDDDDESDDYSDDDYSDDESDDDSSDDDESDDSDDDESDSSNSGSGSDDESDDESDDSDNSGSGSSNSGSGSSDDDD